jgi:hypothetical protein
MRSAVLLHQAAVLRVTPQQVAREFEFREDKVHFS